MSGRKKYSMRELMELAVEVMRKSTPEHRQDGKICPIVGAVLLKTDGRIVTASRGELRSGDHAEYTVLERKNRDENLEGSILFTTLEPCAPESRQPPKTSCAERIVLARIKEVWIGIEDPDPSVDRKGIKYLQDQEVKVSMFDQDLQELIFEENKEFIQQALERVESEKKKVKKIYLTNLEKPVKATLDDLSNDALEYYRSKLKIEEPIDSHGLKLDYYSRIC